jgi:homoserine dehydrogenase
VTTLPRAFLAADVVFATPTPRPRTHAVGLLGCGTVGSGVARRLVESQPGLLRAIAVRNPEKSRDLAWDDGYLDDPFAVVDDPEIDIIVECIGGLGLARELVLRAIARGKHVVTANKDLIATEGPWLTGFASRTGATLRYEAAVGGAIPIVRALDGALAGEDISEIGGVLNGTTNFVLDAMSDGANYASALAEAQRRGFAESDPTSDVGGHDAAHKLTILAALAFHRPATSHGVARRGITELSSADVAIGAQRGLRLKLLAIARRTDHGVEAGVTPAFVPVDHAFARPRGAENVVQVVSRGSGTLAFFGLGAGGDPTGASVYADVLGVLDTDDRSPRTYGGADLVTVPLRAPLLVRYADGEVLRSEAVPLDAIAEAGAALRPGVAVSSAIPLFGEAS